ncbi:hemerythrin domain-containing protein [Streptomyces sp. T-3]|nr:hemerythrin domain-containing protein [Streptomyces sp. T-3]
MTVAQQPIIDLTNMYATHQAFRRDLERFAGAAVVGHATARGVRAGWENFKRQLEIHHQVEDAELWPRLRRAAAGRPSDLAMLDEMEAEHGLLDQHLDAVDRDLAAGSPDQLVGRIAELAEVLGAHMQHEEDSALPLVQEVLVPADWDAFRGAMARRQGVKGASVYVPWVADALPAGDREQFLNGMPKPVRVLNRLLWQGSYRKLGLWHH